jgi:hypothetical protein
LELRVIREQVEGVGGVLKWISSERQFGDGFTKMAARQLLADRLRHGSIKFTWDPEYQASKKKTAAEREKSRNEFTTTTTKITHNHHKPHTTEQEDAHDDKAPATNADENMTVEPYVTDPNLTFENAQLSVDADVTLNVQTPEDVRFMEEIYDIETNAAHGEPLVLPNNQVPVEAYSLSHGGAGAMLKYVFMATAFCTSESVELEVQDQCSADDAPLTATAQSTWVSILIVFLAFLLGLLFHYVVSKQLKEEVRSLRDANAQLLRGQTNMELTNRQLNTENQRLRSTLIDRELVIDNNQELREQERQDDRNTIRRASGILDRAMTETWNLNQFHLHFATTGRCWYADTNCAGLQNANRVETREACTFCLSRCLPPWIPDQTFGTTLKEEIERFWRDHGRVNYVDSIIH